MLEADYLDLIEFNDVVDIYTQLNIDITEDIIRRVQSMGDISQSTKNQIKILVQTNGQEVFNETLIKCSSLSNETKQALMEVYRDMAKEDIQTYKELYKYRDKPFKLSATQYRILNTGLKRTDRTLKNFTNTIAFNSQQIYKNAVDEAYQQVISGAFDYTTAINRTCQKLADSGVTLKDKAGRNVQLEVAVRRNVLTGIRQTADEINRDIEDELGCDGYEVSAHNGARPSHAEQQGKQFAKNKSDAKKFGVGYWGDVEDLWKEYNCHHTYTGIILGVSKPIYTDKQLNSFKNAKVKLNGELVPLYEAKQKQRACENTIRHKKRAIQILEQTGQDTTEAKIQLKNAQKKLTALCKETGLEKDYSRTKITK